MLVYFPNKQTSVKFTHIIKDHSFKILHFSMSSAYCSVKIFCNVQRHVIFCNIPPFWLPHYSDVIMNAMAPKTTDVLIVYSTVCSGADQKNHQSSASLAFVMGIHRSPVTGEFHSQRVSNAENVSIWWRHHVYVAFLPWADIAHPIK